MKKISKILLILLIPFSFFLTSYSFAAWVWDMCFEWEIPVSVSESVPWANCIEDGNKTYCCVAKWFTPVMKMMWAIIKWFTYIAWLAIVLFIVINGIMYSMSGIDQGMKDKAKERIWKTLMWLVILLLSWVILNAIAPWVYK